MKKAVVVAVLFLGSIIGLAQQVTYSVSLTVAPIAITLGEIVHCECSVTNLTNHSKVIDEVEIYTYPIPQCDVPVLAYIFSAESVQIGPNQALTFGADYQPVCAHSHVAYCQVRTNSASGKNMVVARADYTVN
jgi:hypothetical protein